jgi:hypothetical protein
MRGVNFHRWKWVRLSELRRDMFYDLLVKSKYEKVFDDKFIETVQKRRDAVAAMAFKLTTFQIPIFALLVFSLIPIQASVSVLGISPASSRHLREILVVASSLIGLIATYLNIYKGSLNEMLSAYTRRQSKGDARVRRFLDIAYDLDFFVLPDVGPRESLPKSFLPVMFIWIVALVIVFAAVVCAALAIHILILRDIYIDPSYSVRVSIGVIAFVVLCDFITMMASVYQHGHIGLKDYQLLYTVSKLDERDPGKMKAIYRGMFTEHYRKPFYKRWFTKAKLPENLT